MTNGEILCSGEPGRRTFEFLDGVGEKVLPRILTQICRDRTSPFYGCCDRNWWHYKIRDFPSIILQQAGYAIAVAGETKYGFPYSNELKSLASATCKFWNERAVRYGAFEEYYPYERGYPPLAFSTLSVANLCAEGVITVDEVRPGLQRAVHQLLSRFESEASNQQIAGTAALAVISKVSPDMVPPKKFHDVLERTLALQTGEGWFPEYDGPDLGYLSVAMDCLWDIFDATGDKRCRTALDSALNYVAWFVLGPVGTAGMHNSRNTDYILPYGLVRLACEPGQTAETAANVVTRLFSSKPGVAHFFDAIDDRYWCHYAGHSVFRAVRLLSKRGIASFDTATDTGKINNHYMMGSGHVLLPARSTACPSILVSGCKGGIMTAVWPDACWVSDFGWMVESKRQVFISHWWSRTWKVSVQDDQVSCSGTMVGHKEQSSTVWKHMVLRIASFIMGQYLMWVLKRIMIFKQDASRVAFNRTISCQGPAVVVEDRISGLHTGDKPVRAPRSSKRHVASADGFHMEDLVTMQGVRLTEDQRYADGEVRIVTKYELA